MRRVQIKLQHHHVDITKVGKVSRKNNNNKSTCLGGFCNSSNVEELAHVMIRSRARKKISMRTQSMNPKSLACVKLVQTRLVVVLVKFHNFTHSEKTRLKPTSEKKKSS